jgi:ubiquinone biosynthesis protein UbiJ
MIRRLNSFTRLGLLTLGLAGTLSAQTVPPAGKDQEAKLIGVLKSDAPLKEKADACRGLSLIGTKESIAPLAALLGDEKVSHLARYGLEPIPDPAVDEALRSALGTLKGRPLVGVIGSLGVRRDAKAVEPLSGLLKDTDADVAQAAARALGRIGGGAAVEALEGAIESTSAANRLAFAEGLFRCADHLVKHGKTAEALAICDKLNREGSPPQVRESAARKARFLREEPGPVL